MRATTVLIYLLAGALGVAGAYALTRWRRRAQWRARRRAAALSRAMVRGRITSGPPDGPHIVVDSRSGPRVVIPGRPDPDAEVIRARLRDDLMRDVRDHPIDPGRFLGVWLTTAPPRDRRAGGGPR